MEYIRVGIIGVGNIGSAHLNWIVDNPDCGMKITALCDIDPIKQRALRTKYSDIHVFSDYHQLLKSRITDAVIISTPHYLHPIIAIDAFCNDQHVLIEKPAGVYTEKVREMNKIAKDSKKVFSIMFNQRTNPLFLRAREIVQSGQLGTAKRFVWIITNWYRTQAYYDSASWRASWNGEGGGVLLNQAPHNLDIWQWIFGMPNKIFSVCSTGKYHNINVEDDVVIQAEYKNGASATFITSTGETPGTNRLEISGDLGKIVLEKNKLCWWKLRKPEREFCFTEKNAFYRPDTVYEEITSSQPSGHFVILKNFADAILNNTPLIAPGIEGLNSLIISNAAYLSTWTNGWITLPFDEKLFEKYLKDQCNKENNLNKTSNNIFLNKGYDERWQVQW